MLIVDFDVCEVVLGGLFIEIDLVMWMLMMVIEISCVGLVMWDCFIWVLLVELVEEIVEFYGLVVEEVGFDFIVVIDDWLLLMMFYCELLS